MASVWELAGLDMKTYRDLPWPEKRKLIVRYKGIGILPACWDCGKGWHQMREEEFQRTMPAELKQHEFGRLMWLYILDQGQDKEK